MALDLSIPKEFNAGTHISCTVISEAGEPTASVTVDGQAVESSVRWLSEAKYKLFFTLPADAKGKSGEIAANRGADQATESFSIV